MCEPLPANHQSEAHAERKLLLLTMSRSRGRPLYLRLRYSCRRVPRKPERSSGLCPLPVETALSLSSDFPASDFPASACSSNSDLSNIADRLLDQRSDDLPFASALRPSASISSGRK